MFLLIWSPNILFTNDSNDWNSAWLFKTRTTFLYNNIRPFLLRKLFSPYLPLPSRYDVIPFRRPRSIILHVPILHLLADKSIAPGGTSGLLYWGLCSHTHPPSSLGFGTTIGLASYTGNFTSFIIPAFNNSLVSFLMTSYQDRTSTHFNFTIGLASFGIPNRCFAISPNIVPKSSGLQEISTYSLRISSAFFLIFF